MSDFARPPVGRPAATNYSSSIEFRHPAYPDATNPLLYLEAVDDELGPGVNYDLALAACGVIACNRWAHAWFGVKKGTAAAAAVAASPATMARGTRMERPDDRDDSEEDRGTITDRGSDPAPVSDTPEAASSAGRNSVNFERVPRSADGILPQLPAGSAYYFFVSDNESEKYAVVPSFDHWPFPHDIDLPKPWTKLAEAAPTLTINKDTRLATLNRDGGCRMTGVLDALEVAHLVPRQCTGWFQINNMARYCRIGGSVNKIDDDKNMISLRKDLHHLFDQRRFVMVPKRQGPGLSVQHVVHVLQATNGTNSYIHSHWHNRLLQPPCDLPGLGVEFLFARFAWAILCDESFPFLKAPQFTYAISILDPTKGEHTIEHTNKMVKPILFATGSRTKSVSPQKRKLSEATDSDLDEDEEGASDEEDEDDSSDEELRGRTRWRGVSYYRGKASRILSPYSRPSTTSSDRSREQACGGLAGRQKYQSPPVETASSPTVDAGSERAGKHETSGAMPANKRLRIA